MGAEDLWALLKKDVGSEGVVSLSKERAVLTLMRQAVGAALLTTQFSKGRGKL